MAADEWDLFGSCSSGEDADEQTTPAISIRDNVAVGGGRGFFATRDLPAGVLLLCEVPWVRWPEGGDLSDPEALFAAALLILDGPGLEASRSLHPACQAEALPAEVVAVRELHQSRLQHHVDGGGDDEEVVRVLLALQHNGFSSGLYTQLSIFNHSCDPNTIKFSAKCSAGGARMSECWTTRPVQEGEELTIDYCPTSTQLESRIYLHAQHGFVCACPVCQAVDSEGLRRLDLPPRGRGQSPPPKFRVRVGRQELEDPRSRWKTSAAKVVAACGLGC